MKRDPAAEVEATRTASGLYETAAYARYEVSGPDATSWLDRLLACRMPTTGRTRLAPMLNHAGRLMGDLSVTKLDEERYWLVGSYYLQEWHQRWFHQHLPKDGVNLMNVTDEWMGFSLSGPNSRQILEQLTHESVSHANFPLFSHRVMDIGLMEAVVGRLSLTGELGFEVTVPTNQHRTLLRQLLAAGDEHGLRLIGDRAIDSLRLEKAYGIWSAEFTQAYTPGMSGLDRYVAFDKDDFIGREAIRREREVGPSQRLVLLDVDANNADASGDEGIWLDGARVGFVTSGSYGHHVKKSLALGYVDTDVVDASPELLVYVIGEARAARILPEPPYDPKGTKLRS